MTTVNSAAKTIILVAPQDMGISDLIAKNLSHCGFTVIKYERPAFQYKNFFERMVNFFRKYLLRDFQYKIRQQDKIGMSLITKQLNNTKKADYLFVIRPDKFSDELLTYLSKSSVTRVAYQWDSLNRFKGIFSKIQFFDTFFAFDPIDIGRYPQYNLRLVTNFYFDYMPNQSLVRHNNLPIAYFVGTHIACRVPTVVKMLDQFEQVGITPLFLIAGVSAQKQKQSSYKSRPVTFLENNISLEENLKNIETSDIIIDILNNANGGISFRAFEALYYTKKLITNNTNITQYDFYDDHNILIWTDHITPEEIQSFLKKPYRSPNQEIIYKYSFTNWIHYMLGIHPYIALDNCLRQTTTTHIKQ